MELKETDDELLSAYLDGELPADGAEKLEARLAREPALAARLEALRGTGDMAREFYSALDDKPMPASVTRLLETRDEDVPDNVVPFPVRVVRQFAQAPVAIAASVALVAGFLMNDLLDEVPVVTGVGEIAVAGQVAEGTALFDVLETGAGGERMLLSADATAEVVLTFEDTAGDFCRQVRVDVPERRATGVACRRDGGWQFEALAYTGAQTEGTGFTPASDPSLTALDGVVDALLGDGEILDSDAENRLISEGWEKFSE